MGLTMFPYTSAHVCSRAMDAPTERQPMLAPEYLYDLFGVAVHHGTMQNGHYTAFVRRGATWFRCDDASVNVVPPEEVKSCRAYLLFYIRKALV